MKRVHEEIDGETVYPQSRLKREKQQKTREGLEEGPKASSWTVRKAIGKLHYLLSRNLANIKHAFAKGTPRALLFTKHEKQFQPKYVPAFSITGGLGLPRGNQRMTLSKALGQPKFVQSTALKRRNLDKNEEDSLLLFSTPQRPHSLGPPYEKDQAALDSMLCKQVPFESSNPSAQPLPSLSQLNCPCRETRPLEASKQTKVENQNQLYLSWDSGLRPGAFSSRRSGKTNHEVPCLSLSKNTKHRETYQPIGFHNPGNLCFMNAVLQSLIHCKSFTTAVHLDLPLVFDSDSVGHETRKSTTCADENCELCVIADFILQIESSQTATNSIRPPLRLLRCMGPDFIHLNKDPQQQDAHEFLQKFIRALLGARHKHRLAQAEPNPNSAKGLEILFDMGLGSSIKCLRCKFSSKRVEPVLDISLPLCRDAEHPGSPLIISEVIESLEKGEILENANAYACNTCHTKVRACRKSQIVFIPIILVIHLKRFTNVGTKDDTKIQLEKDLTLKSDKRFSLRSLIIHHGATCRSGHYVTFVKSAEDDAKWFLMNDSKVSAMTWDDVIQQEPYILVYERT